jgi:receptor-type tyrosine-protein phosphatase beta
VFIFQAPIVHNDRNGEIREEHPSVRIIIEDLMSGVEYNFQVYVVSHNLISDEYFFIARTMPLIQSEIFIVSGLDPHEKNSVTLTYTPTPLNQRIKFDLYRFSIGDSENEIKEKSVNDTNRKVRFTGLTSGRLYNIKMWTVSGGIESKPILRQDRLHPEPITSLNATKIGDTEISLSWDKPDGEFTTFEVQYLVDNNYASNVTKNDYITITNLKPHRNYTFTVVVQSGTELNVLRSSVPVSAVFQTLESFPGRVHKFSPIDIQPGEITFEWSLPQTEQNGIIKNFTISYYHLENASNVHEKNFGPESTKGTLKNLTPGHTYVFKIMAKTSVGYGPETIWKQKMPILAPPKPSSQTVPTEVHRTSTTLQVRFRKNYFMDTNGNVVMYTIIVAEDDSKNSSGLEMPSWSDVQTYPVWPPYQAVEPYYPFKNSTMHVEDFIIGAENCENRPKGYCNGPLKSGTTYRIKIRAFTAPDKFTDTEYSFPLQTDQDNTSLFVASMALLTLTIVLLLALWLIKRQRYGIAVDARNNDSLSLPDSAMDTSRPVLIKNFAEHYRLMSADSDFRLVTNNSEFFGFFPPIIIILSSYINDP